MNPDREELLFGRAHAAGVNSLIWVILAGGRHNRLKQQWIALELVDYQSIEPVETAAQIYWGGSHQHPCRARHVQHGSACNSSDRAWKAAPFCSRTIQPCGLTTSTA